MARPAVHGTGMVRLPFADLPPTHSADRPACAFSGRDPTCQGRMRLSALGCPATEMPMQGSPAVSCPSKSAAAPSQSRLLRRATAKAPAPLSSRALPGIQPVFGLERSDPRRVVLHIDRKLTACLFVICMQNVLIIDPRDS